MCSYQQLIGVIFFLVKNLTGVIACRFVRFVTTPELLERFVTIEKEIVQIENSIHSNESTSTAGAIEAEGTL